MRGGVQAAGLRSGINLHTTLSRVPLVSLVLAC